MARLTLRQKVEKLVGFLMGLRHPEIATVLADHGFDQNELDEAWALLRRAVGDRLVAIPHQAPSSEDRTLLAAWGARWIPIARATLERHFPDVTGLLLPDADGTCEHDGKAVEDFVTRLADFAATTDRPDVLELLARRGLDATHIREAASLIERIRRCDKAVGDAQPDGGLRDGDAERELWAFYREWSAIARTVIRDGHQLRRLGFKGPAGRPRAGESPPRRRNESSDKSNDDAN